MNKSRSHSDRCSKLKGDIVIVDDNPSNLITLSAMLTENEYYVRSAANASLALDIARSEPPDLIMLDIKMPGMDGYDICKELKADERTREIPIIFISALDDTADKLKAFNSGGVDYITRPFQIQEVIARVETHVTLVRIRKNLEDKNVRLQNEISERKSAEQALQRVRDELEIRVEQRTRELENANIKLKQAKEAAEAASRTKTEFLSNISHELRTPLNPIIGMTELLIAFSGHDEQQRECLDCIRNSAHRLLNIIEDLIELSRIETEGLESANKACSLASVMEIAVDTLGPKALAKNLDLKAHIEPDIPNMIVGDAELLLKILIRIGENAVKFTESGEIEISVTKKEEQDKSVLLLFAVSDTGIGIPSSHLNKLFQDFTQADGSTTRKYDGIGLGLTMARRLVERMGGRIWAESDEGRGTTFYFTLWFTYSETSPPDWREAE